MRFEPTRIRSFGLLVLVGLATGTGCGSVPVTDQSTRDESAVETNSDELERVPIRGPGVLAMRPGRPIGAYDKFKLNRIDVTFARTRYSSADEERIREFVRDYLMRSMEATGLPIVETPDACTLLVEIGVLDVALADPISSTGSSTHFVASWGTATIAQHLFDGGTAVPLMQYAIRRKAKGGTGSGISEGRDWTRIEEMLDRMLRDAQAALLAGLPIVDTPPSKPGCHGGIYELRKRAG
jgi:hypothetical protein